MNTQQWAIYDRLAALGEQFEIPKPRFDLLGLERRAEFLRLTPAARAYLKERIAAGPSRKVGEHTKNNVCAQSPSSSMGHSTNTESRNGELVFVIRAEADSYAIAHWDQAPQVELTAHDKNGRCYTKPYTPDMLVLTNDGLLVVQVKLPEELDKLCQKYPTDWLCEEGRYVYLPATKHFNRLGILHVVWSPQAGSSIFANNLDHLQQFTGEGPEVDQALASRLMAHIKQVRCTTIADLLTQCGLTDCTTVFQLIRDRRLFAELHRVELTHVESALISISEAELKITAERMHTVWAEGALFDGSPQKSLGVEADLQEALRRLAVVESGDKGRSARRYKEAIRLGSRAKLSPIEALLPHRKAISPDDGRKQPKRAASVLLCLSTYIEDEADDIRRLGPCAAYQEYRRYAKKKHADEEPVSRPTFTKALRNRDPVKRGSDRGGVRAANAAEPASDVSDRYPEPTRPFQIAAIDHYRMDVFCEAISDATNRYVAAPWATVLIDLATKFILAIWISFAPPSRTSCAAVFRLCARTHGKVPEAIVVDHGKEFQSVYFEALLAHYAIRKYNRPVSHPRYGGNVERFNQSIRSEFLNHLPGNFVYVKDNRMVSSSHDAKKGRLLDISQLIAKTVEYGSWRNDNYITDKSVSPSISMERGVRLFPFCGKHITVDTKFLIATAVDAGKYTFDPQRGIHIGRYHYVNRQLNRAPQRKFDTRRDPENPYFYYAHCNGAWIPVVAPPHQRYVTASDTQRRRMALLESVPHAIKESQANLAATRRLDMIHGNSCTDDSVSSIIQADYALGQGDGDESDSLFDIAREEHATLECESWK